jgi:hypothetical protein
MAAAEMHLLEKAALDDPMLADALEGYAGTNSAVADLQLLQQRLQNRIEENSRVRRLVIALPWLKAAAVFLVVSGGGLLVFQTLDKKNTLANSSAEETVTVDKSGLSRPNSDSTTINLATTAADSSGRSRNVAVAERNTSRLKSKVATPVTALPSVGGGMVKQSKEAEFKTEPNALAKADSRSEVADTTRTALGNQAANVTVRTLNDSTKQIDVVLKKIDSPVDEVVISKAKAQPTARRTPVVVDSLEPEKGWNSFDDYVAENLKAPDEYKTKPTYNKEVELSFDVDREGNPTNVKVTKSLCEKCDAEAIRILKDGPKWKGKKTKGRVKIKFPLSP